MANVNIYLQGTLTTLSWIAYPFGVLLWYLVTVLLFIWRLLSGPIITLLAPFIYLGRFFLYLVTLPYHVLARFEPLYNFLGVAAIIGLCIGLILHYSSQQFDAIPDVGAIITSYAYEYFPWLEGRTVKQYRNGKLKDRDFSYSVPSSGYASLSDSMHKPQRGKRNLLAQTIVEEADSDF